jgi:hypothetical protein
MPIRDDLTAAHGPHWEVLDAAFRQREDIFLQHDKVGPAHFPASMEPFFAASAIEKRRSMVTTLPLHNTNVAAVGICAPLLLPCAMPSFPPGGGILSHAGRAWSAFIRLCRTAGSCRDASLLLASPTKVFSTLTMTCKGKKRAHTECSGDGSVQN